MANSNVDIANKVFAYVKHGADINQDIKDIYENSLIFIGDEKQIYVPVLNTYVGVGESRFKNLEGSAVWERGEGEISVQTRDSGSYAKGAYSVAEGKSTLALGEGSHAEGIASVASGSGSHAENSAQAIGGRSHAEGNATQAFGSNSHTEGEQTIAQGQGSHAEGFYSYTAGEYSHAEGSETLAYGNNSHAEGLYTEATGIGSHVEGENTIAKGRAAHAEGVGVSGTLMAFELTGSDNSNTFTFDWDSDRYDFDDSILSDLFSKYDCIKFYNEEYNIVSYNISNRQIILDRNVIIGRNLSKDNFIFVTGALEKASHTEGIGTFAKDWAAHAEGTETIAAQESSHAEGYGSFADGIASHAEGADTIVKGFAAHAEGQLSKAIAQASHTEGWRTTTNGVASHAEGAHTYTGGNFSSNTLSEYTNHGFGCNAHAEGNSTIAYAFASHAEGIKTFASGYASHAEGAKTTASGHYSHASGYNTTASGAYSNAWGLDSQATNNYSTAFGNNAKATGQSAFANGFNVTASGNNSHAEGQGTTATGRNAHAEGLNTTANVYAHAEGQSTRASGTDAHAEGNGTTASGNYAHSEGQSTTASAVNAHAEGNNSTASGAGAHAEGTNTTASGKKSHSEGHQTTAYGENSHAEGYRTTAYGVESHSEGSQTKAEGISSHSEGWYTYALGNDSHAEGVHTYTYNMGEHAQGSYNLAHKESDDFGDSYNSLFTIGIGTSDADRANMVLGMQNGDVYIVNIGDYDGTNPEDAETIQEVIGRTAVWEWNEDSETGAQIINSGIATGNYSVAAGYDSIADGDYSFTEGHNTEALGTASHAEGSQGIAYGDYSHVEGYDTIVRSDYGHAEGRNSIVTENAMGGHAEGNNSQVHSDWGHAEGFETDAWRIAHAEGEGTKAYGDVSHAEGNESKAWGDYSHAEGYRSYTAGISSHAEGHSTFTGTLDYTDSDLGSELTPGADDNEQGIYAHAEGNVTIANGPSSHTEGRLSYTSGVAAHAEGEKTVAKGRASHAEGSRTYANTSYSHTEGYATVTGGSYTSNTISTLNTTDNSNGMFAHAEGQSTIAKGNSSHAEGIKTFADNFASHAEGQSTIATGSGAHAEGQGSKATNHSAHAEGRESEAIGFYSHAEGFETKAYGQGAHAEGGGSMYGSGFIGAVQTIAYGNYSHAEGKMTYAIGEGAHSEGFDTVAKGDESHTEGKCSYTVGTYSHAEGEYTYTYNLTEHSEGRYNYATKDSDTFGSAGNTHHTIGIGTAANNRRNAVAIMENGNAYFINIGNFDGNNFNNARPLQDLFDSSHTATGTEVTTGSHVINNWYVDPDTGAFSYTYHNLTVNSGYWVQNPATKQGNNTAVKLTTSTATSNVPGQSFITGIKQTADGLISYSYANIYTYLPDYNYHFFTVNGSPSVSTEHENNTYTTVITGLTTTNNGDNSTSHTVSYAVAYVATKKYVDDLILANDALRYCGTVSPATEVNGEFTLTHNPSPHAGHGITTPDTSRGAVYKVTGVGYFGTERVTPGDMIISYSDETTGSSATGWDVINENLDLRQLVEQKINSNNVVTNVKLEADGTFSYSYNPITFGTKEQILTGARQKFDLTNAQLTNNYGGAIVNLNQNGVHINNVSKSTGFPVVTYAYIIQNGLHHELQVAYSYIYSDQNHHSYNDGVKGNDIVLNAAGTPIMTGVKLSSDGILSYAYSIFKVESSPASDTVSYLYSKELSSYTHSVVNIYKDSTNNNRLTYSYVNLSGNTGTAVTAQTVTNSTKAKVINGISQRGDGKISYTYFELNTTHSQDGTQSPNGSTVITSVALSADGELSYTYNNLTVNTITNAVSNLAMKQGMTGVTYQNILRANSGNTGIPVITGAVLSQENDQTILSYTYTYIYAGQTHHSTNTGVNSTNGLKVLTNVSLSTDGALSYTYHNLEVDTAKSFANVGMTAYGTAAPQNLLRTISGNTGIPVVTGMTLSQTEDKTTISYSYTYIFASQSHHSTNTGASGSDIALTDAGTNVITGMSISADGTLSYTYQKIKATSAAGSDQLNETHTFWGQEFNGTQDVSGNMIDIGYAYTSGNIKITKSDYTSEFNGVEINANSNKIKVGISNDGDNRGIYDDTQALFYTNGNASNAYIPINTVISGTATRPVLTVEGNEYISGNLDVSSWIRSGGKAYIGTGGSSYNTYIYSDSNNNIYAYTNGKIPLVIEYDGTNLPAVRPGVNTKNATLGTSSYPYAYSYVNQFVSKQTTFAPFAVSSKVLNVNLNADYLDGEHSYQLRSKPDNGSIILYTTEPFVNAKQNLNSTWLITESPAPADAPYAYCFGPVTASTTYYSPYINVTPGEKLTAEMWVYRPTNGGEPAKFYLGLERYDRNMKPIASNSGCQYNGASNTSLNATGEWHKFTGNWTIPTSHTPYPTSDPVSDGGGVYFVRLRLLFNYQTPNMTTYFGGVKLYRKNSIQTAPSLTTTHTFAVSDSDGTNTGTAQDFNGTQDVVLPLPSYIIANIQGSSTVSYQVQTTSSSSGAAYFTFVDSNNSSKANEYLYTTGNIYGTAEGALTATGKGTFKTITITDNTAAKHIEFSRASWNYLSAPSSGSIAFVVNGKSAASANTDVVIQDKLLAPGTNLYSTLGSTSLRWNGIYSSTGNFTGQITSSLATGTAPFAVTSTTVNTNLNADMLDGYHATGNTNHIFQKLELNGNNIKIQIGDLEKTAEIWGDLSDPGVVNAQQVNINMNVNLNQQI